MLSSNTNRAKDVQQSLVIKLSYYRAASSWQVMRIYIFEVQIVDLDLLDYFRTPIILRIRCPSEFVTKTNLNQ